MSYPSYSLYSQYNDDEDDDDVDDIPNCPSESSAMEIDLEYSDEFVPRAPEPSGPFGMIKKRFKTRFWSSGEPIAQMDYENLNEDADEPLEEVMFSKESIDDDDQIRNPFKGKGKGKGKKSGK